MAIKYHKSCYGCRALRGLSLDQYCLLEYKIRTETVKHEWGKSEEAIPNEPCPKPRTWKQYDLADRKPANMGMKADADPAVLNDLKENNWSIPEHKDEI